MQTYSGAITIGAAGTFVAVDIDPAERSGYVNEVVAVELISDIAAVPGYIHFGLSVKIPVRTTYDESDMFAADIIQRAVPASSVMSIDPTEDVTNSHSILDRDAFFQSTLRLFVATRDGAGAANAETVYYRVHVEERKLTDSIRNTINQRAYS